MKASFTLRELLMLVTVTAVGFAMIQSNQALVFEAGVFALGAGLGWFLTQTTAR